MVTSEVILVVTEPTDWCSAMVLVVKKNGTVRICVDLKGGSAIDLAIYYRFQSL